MAMFDLQKEIKKAKKVSEEYNKIRKRIARVITLSYSIDEDSFTIDDWIVSDINEKGITVYWTVFDCNEICEIKEAHFKASVLLCPDEEFENILKEEREKRNEREKTRKNNEEYQTYLKLKEKYENKKN